MTKRFNRVTGETPVVVKTVKPAAVAPGTVLENSYVRIDARKDGTKFTSINGDDKTDKNNEPRFFTKNKRGLAAQWTALSDRFNADTRYRDAIHILSDHGAKIHDYCAMD